LEDIPQDPVSSGVIGSKSAVDEFCEGGNEDLHALLAHGDGQEGFIIICILGIGQDVVAEVFGTQFPAVNTRDYEVIDEGPELFHEVEDERLPAIVQLVESPKVWIEPADIGGCHDLVHEESVAERKQSIDLVFGWSAVPSGKRKIRVCDQGRKCGEIVFGGNAFITADGLDVIDSRSKLIFDFTKADDVLGKEGVFVSAGSFFEVKAHIGNFSQDILPGQGVFVRLALQKGKLGIAKIDIFSKFTNEASFIFSIIGKKDGVQPMLQKVGKRLGGHGNVSHNDELADILGMEPAEEILSFEDIDAISPFADRSTLIGNIDDGHSYSFVIETAEVDSCCFL